MADEPGGSHHSKAQEVEEGGAILRLLGGHAGNPNRRILCLSTLDVSLQWPDCYSQFHL